MHSGKGDTVSGRRRLRGRPEIEIGHEIGEARLRISGGKIVSEGDEAQQVLPTLTDGTRAARGLLGPAHRGQHRADVVGEQARHLAPAGRTAQPGDGLAYLATLEERGFSPQHIRNRGLGQCLFEHLGLRIDAVEDGDLSCRSPCGDESGDRLRDGGRLTRLIVVGAHHGLGPIGAGCAQLEPQLGLGARRTGQNTIRQRHHLRGRAVGPHQAYLGGMGETRAKVDEIGRARTREGVDGLAGIADNTEVVAVAEPELEEPLLQGVDVLVLIDGEPAIGRADLIDDIGAGVEHPDGEQQDILEVDEPLGCLAVVVGRVDRRDIGVGEVAGWFASRPERCRGVVRCHHLAGLGPLDLAGDVAGQ
ncbi:unannotated protein [freshwater metagenome]|uniref:Unannotated protein n=1 Tax=freshwater metagenome TaxID=449393 RepID=A0A6J7C613_9ZZZZ